MNNMQFVSLHKEQEVGSYGSFGIDILVGGSLAPKVGDHDLDARVSEACYKAAQEVGDIVRTVAMEKDPEAQAAKKAQREQLIGLFPQHILVEEVPNGYCSRWCCKHLPWFVVTTKVGRIQIGRRKRVINIDWTNTKGTKTAEELFPKEEVTKGDCYIHAWSEEDARRYITTIIESATLV